MFATFPTAWPGLPQVLLQDQRHSRYWSRPPANAWLYAGVVTNAGHLEALTTYAMTHAVPILAIVGRIILPMEHWANCIEWPLPIDPGKPSSCISADHMRRTGTPGCIAADLRLLNASSAEHPALDLPDWLRLWPMLFQKFATTRFQMTILGSERIARHCNCNSLANSAVGRFLPGGVLRMRGQ